MVSFFNSLFAPVGTFTVNSDTWIVTPVKMTDRNSKVADTEVAPNTEVADVQIFITLRFLPSSNQNSKLFLQNLIF